MGSNLCKVLALADDLSGAAEVAASLRPLGRTVEIELARDDEQPIAHNAHSVLVVDLDTRTMPSARASRVTRAALDARGAGCSLIFLKIDSLLRGNVGAVVRSASDRPVVVAPALPSGGRTIIDGAPYVRGVPLRETDTWEAESAPPPRTVAEALAPLPCRTVPLDVVRSSRLNAALAECAALGRVAVCDSENDSDLDEIVAAAALPGARLAGAGGLAAALGRGTRRSSDARSPAGNPGDQLLVVVGTADPSAAEQVRFSASRGMPVVACDAGELLGRSPLEDAITRITSALASGPTVLTIDTPGRVGADQARNLVRGLAATAACAVGRANGRVDLVLTGGETARRVLDALTVKTLVPISQVHHGAVHSRTPAGTSVVTRPGSFGDVDSLVRIVEHLRPAEIERRLKK